MKILQLAMAIAVMACLCCTAQAYVLTFDDVPAGDDPGQYYYSTYGVALDFPTIQIVDHAGSVWGPPHSDSNVLIVPSDYDGNYNRMTIMLFQMPDDGLGHKPQYANAVGAHFSTQQDVVLQMVAYSSGQDNPVASAYIGADGQSWIDQYVEVGSPAHNIDIVYIYPVTDHAFLHFCLDDLTVVPVPEPASLLALCAGLIPLALKRRRG